MSEFDKDPLPAAEQPTTDRESGSIEMAEAPADINSIPETSDAMPLPLSSDEFATTTEAVAAETASNNPQAISADDIPAIAEVLYQEDTPPFSAPQFAETNTLEAIIAVPQIERDFEDLTLAELIGQFWRAPRYTWQALSQVIKPDQTEIKKTPLTVVLTETPAADAAQPQKERQSFFQIMRLWAANPASLKLALYTLALFFAITGTLTLANDLTGRTEEVQLVSGAPFLLLGILVWLIAEVFDHHQVIRHWWQALDAAARWRLFARAVPILIVAFGIGRLLDASDENVSDVAGILAMIAPGIQAIAAGTALWLVQDALIAFNTRRRKHKPMAFSADEAMFEATSVSTQISASSESHHHDSHLEAELPFYLRIHPARVFLLMLGLFLSIITFVGSANNEMRVPELWFASIVSWSLAFAPAGWNPLTWLRDQWQKIITFRLTADNRWIAISLIAIMCLGAAFRLQYLDEVPPQMTSDHVEKLLDSARVANGSRDIFFANNGGREPFQMYAMAIFSQLPGQGINHHSLKLLAIIESLITLPVLFWFGREVLGGDNRRLGILVGLLLAALVAASYWHTSVTRLGLRIVLTPLMTALLLIYLSRAMRHNHRADFIKAGLVLGFGLYMYQAVRMLPIVILVAIAIAIYFSARNWQQRFKYGLNLAALVLIAFVVFIPMFRYSLDNPDQFWRRTAGRLLGDELITETLPDGRLVDRFATLEERLQAFNQNIPVLLNNIRNAVLMFNWKGDVAWINGAPNEPALDTISGAWFILGLAAWGILLIKKRDVVHWLMPITLFIMLLPSALSIAYPVENPSFTRTSGALPIAFLLAAYPLALWIELILRYLPNIFGRVLAVSATVLMILGSYGNNASLYFTDFVASYNASTLPYTEAGQVLRGFAISDGSYGNAFMLAYRYWWDHRAIGLAAGLETTWANGVYDYIANDTLTRAVDYVPHFIRDALNRTDIFRLIPDRDLLFFYSVDDLETAQQLVAWFPQGNSLRFVTQQWGDDFMIYRVPALGFDGIYQFIADRGL
jgi:hypothetical protein